MTPEQWKDITGLEGVYQVSDQGRVRSLDRITNIGHKRKGAMIKTPPNNSGYPEVRLWKGGKLACAAMVHCLVLEAFVGQCPEGEENYRPQMLPSGVEGEILRGMNSEYTSVSTVGALLVLNMPCLKEADAAVLMNVTPKCLKKRRLGGCGPDYIRISQRLVRYTPLAILEYASAHEVPRDVV